MTRKFSGTGQTTVEMAVLVGAAVAALVAMAVYVQRAYQGYLYAGGSAHGGQFHPEQPYNETQNLSLTQTQEIDVLRGEPGVGDLPDDVLLTKSTVTSDWSVNRDGSYEAR